MSQQQEEPDDLDGRDAHFVRHVAELGDRRPLVASQPIFNSRKLKLIEAGATIDSRLLNRLLEHKLLRPIDRDVTVEGAFSTADLGKALLVRLEQVPAFAPMQPAFGDAKDVTELCEQVHIEPQLAVKLTVAQELNPKLLQRTLDVALVAAYLARKISVSNDLVVCALSAGLFLDIGLLHIDPEILASPSSLTVEQRRHIYSHPVIAYHVLNAYPKYRGAIATAVLQHHERCDGSGYPAGLRSAAISALGHVLMLADTTGAVLRRGETEPVRASVWTAFGLARHKFMPRLIDLVIELAGKSAEPNDGADAVPTGGTEPLDAEATQLVFGRMSAVIGDWNALLESREITNGARDPFIMFVRERVETLARTLAEAGFDWRAPDHFVEQVGTTPAARAELGVLAHEALWHIRDVMHEAHRESARFKQAGQDTRDVLAWCDRSLAALNTPK